MTENIVVETEEGEEIEITFEDVKGLLDSSYELVYIDYRSNLEDDLESVQKAIQTQEWYPLDETLDEWYSDSQIEGLDYALDELQKEVEREFDLEDAQDIIEQFREEIEQEIYDRDRSNPIKDLLSNTGEIVFFYDTGTYIEESGFDDEMFEDNMALLRDVLQVKDGSYDKVLWSLLAEASYGGRVVIYFRDNAENMMNIGENKTIIFKNPMVAIIDTFNGSGHNEDLPGHEISLSLDPKNIFIDKTFKYSYVYSVCGMYGSFCDCTRVSFSKEDLAPRVVESSLHVELAVEETYKKAFTDGGCTFGDMDIHRHRNVYYLNEFPCGLHCPHCKTFWID